ncbi:MAG: flippase-like domain-containing protein [Thermomicrobiales bacterium]|nr:flippase-like domain-containing protein [Thermomicrobiales bacterium]
MFDQLRSRLLIGVAAGVAVMAAILLIFDAGDLTNALRDFDWRFVPAILALTLLNYVLRFVKWQYYLRTLGVNSLSRGDSALIFVAGFTMALTPGKVGEYLKSYLIRVRSGVPMARTAPVIFAERLSDGVAMLILASSGLLFFRHGWQILVAGAIAMLALVILLQRESLVRAILERIGRTRLHKYVHLLEQAYDSMRELLRPRPLAVAIGLGTVSWLGECLAFVLVLIGLGIEPSWHLVAAGIFVFASATWIGGASMLPGGLGAADLSVAALLLLTIDDPAMTRSLAGAATLLIRFATLWFGILIGIVALARVSRWQEVPRPNDASV